MNIIRIKEKHLRYRKHNYVVILNYDEDSKTYSVKVNDLDDNCKIVEGFDNVEIDDAQFYYSKWIKQYTKKKQIRSV